MSDRIFIAGLSLHAYHGVMPYEGKVGQTFTIDIELDIDLAEAARSDKVVDTVSYDKVVTCASAAFCAQKFRLIEAAAGKVADAVLAGFPRVRKIKVDDPQAARPDRGDLQRRRRHARARAGRTPVMTPAWLAQAYLAFGGNVGDSRTILDRAVSLLCDGKEVRLTARSSDYRTPPWGFKYQPPFINLCIAVETALAPRDLLARAQDVELHSAATAPTKSAGVRAPPISTSSLMAASPSTNWA